MIMKKQELADSLHAKQISVLLAEDNAPFRRSLKVLIELDGDIEVVGEAKNGLEAVRLTGSLHPEVIIMDVAMPLLNGLQATSEIRQHERQLREGLPRSYIAIMTGRAMDSDKNEATLSGCDEFLTKPVALDVIQLLVRTHVNI